MDTMTVNWWVERMAERKENYLEFPSVSKLEKRKVIEMGNWKG